MRQFFCLLYRTFFPTVPSHYLPLFQFQFQFSHFKVTKKIGVGVAVGLVDCCFPFSLASARRFMCRKLHHSWEAYIAFSHGELSFISITYSRTEPFRCSPNILHLKSSDSDVQRIAFYVQLLLRFFLFSILFELVLFYFFPPK